MHRDGIVGTMILGLRTYAYSYFFATPTTGRTERRARD
jgi:hypothetical protein